MGQSHSRREVTHRVVVVNASEDPGAVTVVVSTAVEFVTRLYVSAHVEKGDFEQLPEHGGDLVPDGSRELLFRYFGADFSLGMSLVSFAVAHGWDTVADLLRGVEALDGDELASAMLASTTLEPQDQQATRKLVAAALTDPEQRAMAARKVARRNAFRREDVAHVLEDPSRAHRELTGLLRESADAFRTEAAVRTSLVRRAEQIRDHVAAHGREHSLLELTGGWTLRSEAQPIVLAPTESLGPLVITRLLPDQQILVAFGPARRRERELTIPELATVARALSSEQRIAILRHVAHEPASGQTLARALQLTQATVHYHTALLRSSGLITSTRDTHSVLHAVDGEHLRRALGLLADTVLSDTPSTLEQPL